MPRSVWVLYEGDRRLAEFDSEEAALRWIRANLKKLGYAVVRESKKLNQTWGDK